MPETHEKRRDVVWLPGELLRALIHMARELVRARVLLWGILLTLVASAGLTWLSERPTLPVLLVNYVLLLLYALVIRGLTGPERPRKPGVRWPHAELGLFLVYATWVALYAFSTEIPYLSSHLRAVAGRVVPALDRIDPFWARQFQVGIWPVAYVFLGPWLIWTLLVYRPHQLGLRPRRLRVAAALIALGILPALVAVARQDIRGVLVSGAGAFVIAIFMTGLPAEFFYRGILLSRLEAVMGNRLDALAVCSFIAGAGRLPALIQTGAPSTEIIGLAIAGIGDPFNLALGYLFLRTRSVWPGTLWQAAAGTIGIAFL